MSHPVFSDFYKRFNQIVERYQCQDYDAALAALDQTEALFPSWRWLIIHMRACIAAVQGDSALAITHLRAALDNGLWLPADQWEDSDFDAFRDTPEFQGLRARSAEMRLNAQTQARPEMLIRLPGSEAAEPYPLLMGLHGHSSTGAESADFWRSAAQYGWVVGLPQASHLYAPGAYTWGTTENTWGSSEAQIGAHIDALCRAYPIDQQRIVLGGFSLGAELAIKLALTGTVSACGFIAVGTGGMLTGWETERWQPLIRAAQGRDVRGVIIVGAQDSPRLVEHSLKLAEMLQSAGFACELEEHPDLAHEFPPDFGARLEQHLAHVVGVPV